LNSVFWFDSSTTDWEFTASGEEAVRERRNLKRKKRGKTAKEDAEESGN
jgi:hypothetical protein